MGAAWWKESNGQSAWSWLVVSVESFIGRASGGGGIRTHERGNPVTGFQDRRLQPLGHPTGIYARVANKITPPPKRGSHDHKRSLNSGRGVVRHFVAREPG